jgi:hypothetical protein
MVRELDNPATAVEFLSGSAYVVIVVYRRGRRWPPQSMTVSVQLFQACYDSMTTIYQVPVVWVVAVP